MLSIRTNQKLGQPVSFDEDLITKPAEIFSRLMVMSCCVDMKDHSPHVEKASATSALLEAEAAQELLIRISTSIHPEVGAVFANIWESDASLAVDADSCKKSSGNQDGSSTKQNLLSVLCANAATIAMKDSMWWSSVGNALCESISNLHMQVVRLCKQAPFVF